LISLKVEPRHYAPNDAVIHKGDSANELFFIVEGMFANIIIVITVLNGNHIYN
jgi:CRP-like cAMP-binding protein